MKKILKVLLIIFFPLGIIYCVGKNLFSGNVAQFLGGIFLAVGGACTTIYFLRYDLVEPIFEFINKFI